MMRAYFGLLVDNPVLLELGAAVQSGDSAAARFSETIQGCLRRLGLDHRTSVGLKATLLRYVIGCAYLYPIRRAWDDDPDHWERHRQRLAALPPEAYPSTHDLAMGFPTFTQVEAFEFGLESLLTAVVVAAGLDSNHAGP